MALIPSGEANYPFAHALVFTMRERLKDVISHKKFNRSAREAGEAL